MIFGDLERLFAQLYPYRVVIALGIAIAGGMLVVIGRRRGWLGVVRRHRGASLAALALVLLVGLPLGWVLGSPLVIRTQVDEGSPLAVVTESAGPGPSVDASGAIGGSPSTAPRKAQVIARGAFSGADEFHFGSGDALLVETEPGRYVLRFEEFSVRNGPDLFVYLSPSAAGYAEGSLELGALKASDGSFNYEVPEGTDASAFRSAVVWCRAFSVQFASAPLAAV